MERAVEKTKRRGGERRRLFVPRVSYTFGKLTVKYRYVKTKNIQFKNAKGLALSARLELPPGAMPVEFAVFAHCFTCGKNSRASTDISRQLTQAGFGVLRFDFTGLGQSEGDFEDTDFTSNVSDLKAAADFLKAKYSAPSLLVGHSLGGTAVLHVAHEIESVRAVATIGSPMEASHILSILAEDREEIEKQGKAKVNIGGRPFWVGADFIKDLERHSTAKLLPELKKALLIMHSPQDLIVSIDNAAKIFIAAFHPKSFISLDGADHLLTDKKDSTYVANVLAAWAGRYIDLDKPKIETVEDVAVQLGMDRFTTEVVAGRHSFLSDEPESVGGNDLGPSPYQLLSAALGTCTAMTLRMYADRKKWPMERVTVHLSYKRHHATDSAHPEKKKSRIDVFSRILEIEGDLDDDQRARLVEIANRCPVHRTLTDVDIRVDTELRV